MSRAERAVAVPSWGATRRIEVVPREARPERTSAPRRERVRLAPAATALRDGTGLVLVLGGTIALWAAFLAAVS